MTTDVILGITSCGVAVVTAIASTALVLFHGGRQVGRVESAISRLTNIEEKLNKVIDHDIKISVLTEAYDRMRSDFKDLKRRVEGTAEETAEMRGKYGSQHGT
jgi:hypothetical protein